MPRVYLCIPPELRFWPKVEIGEGCWRWTGGYQSKGYGLFKFQGRMQTAHRVAFMLANGLTDLPRSVDVCHTCDNRQCVNPAHLFSGSRSENMLDASKKGRFPLRCLPTRCPSGHAYTAENTYRPPNRGNERQCRECNRAHNRAWIARR